MTTSKPIGVIILAGGLSSRMGSEKGLVEINGKPMIRHVIQAAKKISGDILIVANNPAYGQFGLPVFQDEFRGKGPLAGIYTGLNNSSHAFNLVLPCDVPFISPAILEVLADYDATYAISVAGHHDKTHPLIGVYSKMCMPVIEQHIAADRLKVTGIFEQLKSRIIPFSDEEAGNFRNINSREDL